MPSACWRKIPTKSEEPALRNRARTGQSRFARKTSRPLPQGRRQLSYDGSHRASGSRFGAVRRSAPRRDLYQKLTTMEPGNPLHMSNYQQVASQVSGDSGATLISAEEATVIVDELEATAPSIHQHYSDAVALAVRSALTDAELFISYNMPAKAMGPLLSALPRRPRPRLNQRLASLHTRAGLSPKLVCAAALCRRSTPRPSIRKRLPATANSPIATRNAPALWSH